MPGDSLVPRNQQRLSRKALRDWLEANGPRPLTAIVAFSKVLVPSIDRDSVEAILRENPRLFVETDQGKWHSAPKPEFVRVAPRPRRPARAPKAVPAPSPARTTRNTRRDNVRDRVPPRNGEPVVVERGRVACLTFARGVSGLREPLESGRHLLLSFPQSPVEVSPAIIKTLVTAFTQTTETDTYEIRTGRLPVFRGRRPVLQVRVSSDQTHVNVVLGPGVGDEGLLFGLITGAPSQLLIPARADAAADPEREVRTRSAGTALVPATYAASIAASLALSPDLQQLAISPSPRRKFDRVSARKAASIRLEQVRRNGEKWAEFHEWLVCRKPEYDSELLQEILDRALHLAERDPMEVLRLARLVLSDDVPLQHKFARTCFLALYRRLADNDALSWAKRIADSLEPEAEQRDLEVELASAYLATYDERYADACRLFRAVAEADAALLEPEDLDVYLSAVASLGDRSAFRVAEALVNARADQYRTPEELRVFIPVLRQTVATAFDLASVDTSERLLERTLLALLSTGQESQAVDLFELWVLERTKFSVRQRFNLLSVLARCEDALCLREVLGFLVSTTRREFPKLRVPDQLNAIEDIRYIETQLGAGHADSDELRLQLKLARPDKTAVTAASPSALVAKRIVIIGGRASTRERIRRDLQTEHKIASCDEIPPSWERRIDEASVRSKVLDADFVVELTDCIKHDAQQILRGLQRSGLAFIWVMTAGGPSRAIHELLSRAKPA